MLKRRLPPLMVAAALYLLLSSIPNWPLALVSVALSATALAFSIKRSVVTLVLASIVLALSIISTIGMAVLNKELSQFNDCQLGANTSTAEDACLLDLRNQLDDKVKRLENF